MALAVAFTAATPAAATRLPVATAGPARASPALFLPRLPSPRRQLLSSSLLPARRLSQVVVKASSDETSGSAQADVLLADLKEKWDGLENKSTVIIYGGGAIVAVWLSSVVIGAINSVPLLPKIMELVGLGYTGWFVYRYLLFKSSRKELVSDIEDLKKKIGGSE